MKFTILVDLSLVIITLYLSDSCDLKDWPLVKSGKGKQLRENFRLAVKQKLHGPNRSPEKKTKPVSTDKHICAKLLLYMYHNAD